MWNEKKPCQEMMGLFVSMSRFVLNTAKLFFTLILAICRWRYVNPDDRSFLIRKPPGPGVNETHSPLVSRRKSGLAARSR